MSNQAADAEVSRKFVSLKKEHEDLSHRRTRVVALIESEKMELAKLKAQAVEKFQTSDVSAIRAMLEDKRNKRKETVETIEKELTAFKEAFVPVEQKVGDANNS